MSLLSRLRERFGIVPDKGLAGFRRQPGPFETPLEEPVELDEADLPWELRDSETQE